ncbi:MAG: 4Fe-4S cluster-binding domain-containing protein [Clostridia bacterium]|nr:4Fe-4S cluster-binding domain-containing protein [Clostridia bacterium]
MSFLCNLCPRMCNVERGLGFCGMGEDPVIARAAPHYDEEPVISGERGSGAIFFSGCALKCRFCQNQPISHENFGKKVSVARLREIYNELTDKGVHNINLVNPTHWAKAIHESLTGFDRLPVVWNCGGYERTETIKAMEGRVQVYLPDLKYMDPYAGERYSAARDYFDFASKALIEMNRQTGPVKIGDDGIIISGTIVRHLIMPGRTEESKQILSWIKENLPGAWVSVMAQYMPMGDVAGVDELDRRLMQDEYDEVCEHMFDIGLEDGFLQELESSDAKYIPIWDLTGV